MQYLSPFNPQAREKQDKNRKRSLKEIIRDFLQSLKNSWRGIWQALQLVWQTSHLLTCCLGIATLIQAVVPAISIYITKLLIDTIVQAVTHSNVAGNYIGPVILLAVIQLGISSLSNLLTTLTSTFRQLLQDATANRVEYVIMSHATKLDLSFFEQSEFYNALQNAQREATMRPVLMVAGVFDLMRDFFTFLSMTILLIHLQWLLAVFILLAPLPAFLSNAKYSQSSFQLMQHQSSIRRIMLYLSMLLSTDTFHKEIQVFQLSDFFLERFKHLSAQLFKENRSLYTKRAFVVFGWEMLTTLVTSGMFLYVALLALYRVITLGDVSLYTQAVISVQASFQSLLTGFATMYENNLYMSTLSDVLSATSRIKSPERPVPFHYPLTQGIEFRNVTYAYEGAAKPSLHNVSFTLPLGKTLAIVGKNGAGKTTLVKLLTRLYDPQEGEILINGHNIREYDLADLRAIMSVIFQDYICYQLTAQENIGVGNISQLNNLQPIEAAATKSGADELIATLPEGYQTMLGRWFGEGHQLSGGEWQKIALARAFMRNAPILVLDEPTASLDAQAEYELFKQIQELAEDHTTIFISHRFSTVRLADHILVIENGSIVEQGNHEQLLALDGQYAHLFNLQASAYK